MDCQYYSGDNWSKIMDWCVKVWYTEELKQERLNRLTSGRHLDDLWCPVKYYEKSKSLVLQEVAVPHKTLISYSAKERKFYFRLPY